MLLIAGVWVLANQRNRITGDGLIRFNALTELLAESKLINTQYSMIGPVFAAPLWYLGRPNLQKWLSHYNLLLFLLGLIVMYVLLHNRMDRALLRRFLLLVVAASMVAPHVTNFYGEMFTAMGVGVGVVAALVRIPGGWGRLTRIAGWTAVTLGAANTPASIPGLGLASAGHSLYQRRLRFLIPLVAGAALVLGEAWLRRGNPFDNGYAGTENIERTLMPYSGEPGFSYPFFFGVLSILFSFGKGIVFYLPGLMLPVRRKIREMHDAAGVDLFQVYRLWILFVLGLVVAYASWWAWYGGWYWGPRFFLVGILPASLALAVCLSYRNASPAMNLATLAVLGLSVWVAADSLVFGALPIRTCTSDHYEFEMLCHYTPDYSALWYPFVVKPQLSPDQVIQAIYYGAVFCWLAAPVTIRLGRQVAHWTRHHGWPHVAPAHWRI